MREFARNTAMLGGAFEFTSSRAIATRSQSVFEVLPCDDSGLWGLRPDFLVVDELAQWPDSTRARERFESVATALPKVDGRMVVTTTPGAPGHWAHAVYEHALEDRLWVVHETRGPLPWISAERLEGERRRLPESLFRRLHYGEWVEPEDRLALLDDIHACVDPNPDGTYRRGSEYVVAADLSYVKDRSVIVVAHGEVPDASRPDYQVVVVDHLMRWTPTRDNPVWHPEVEAHIESLARAYDARVQIDAWNAIGVMQRLKMKIGRVSLWSSSPTDVARCTINLQALIKTHSLRIPDDPELIDELANVRLREMNVPGAYRLDHQHGRHDDQAVTLAIAALAITDHPPTRGPRIRSLR